MILLGAYAGLRCMEIARVHSRDWDGSGLYVTGKGGKTRYVPIIRMDLRRALSSCDGYLFPGQDGGHLSAGYVSKRLARALPAGWTGHTLRHCHVRRYARPTRGGRSTRTRPPRDDAPVCASAGRRPH
jgi:integrase